jgi:hypothetical protein
MHLAPVLASVVLELTASDLSLVWAASLSGTSGDDELLDASVLTEKVHVVGAR